MPNPPSPPTGTDPAAIEAAFATALREAGSGDFVQDTGLRYLSARGIFADRQGHQDGGDEAWAAAKRAVLTDGQTRTITISLPVDGNVRPLSVTLAAIRAAGGTITGLVGTGLVTDTDPASQQRAKLFAKANHDLRQPFQAMRLFLHLLEARATEPKQAELVQRLGDAVEAAAHQVGSLLDLSVLQAGTAKLSPGPVALGPLLERLVEEFQPQAEAAGVHLRHVATGLSTHSDGMMLDRLLRQLLGNAIRHAGTGDKGGKVLLGVRRRGGELSLDVLDNGPGIPVAEQEQVFQEFTQLEEAGRGKRGLGLGLAIVRHGARALGHRVGLHSRPGHGSHFALTLAWHGAPPRPAAAPLPAPAAMAALPPAPLAALVEDDRLQLAALEAMLEEWGCQTAVGGSQAELEQALAGRRPDIIITDLHLPGGVCGPDLVAAMRARLGAPLPGLLLTGDATPEARARAQAAGMYPLGKPIAPQRLRRAIEQALGRTLPGL